MLPMMVDNNITSTNNDTTSYEDLPNVIVLLGIDAFGVFFNILHIWMMCSDKIQLALTIHSMENLICLIRVFYVGFLSPTIGYLMVMRKHLFDSRLFSFTIAWLTCVVHHGIVIYLATLACLRAYYLYKKTTHASVFDINEKSVERLFVGIGISFHVVISIITFLGTPHHQLMLEMFVDEPYGTERSFLKVVGTLNVIFTLYNLASSIFTLYTSWKLYDEAKNSTVNSQNRKEGSINMAINGCIHISLIIIISIGWIIFHAVIVEEWTNRILLLLNVFTFSLLYGIISPISILLNYIYTRNLLRKLYRILNRCNRNRVSP